MNFRKKQKKNSIYILITLISITILGVGSNSLNQANLNTTIQDLENDGLNPKIAVYREWNRSYDIFVGSPGPSLDEDVALDSNKNIYVAGFEDSMTTNYDILLIKYNQSGEFEWAQSFQGNLSTGYDFGYSVAVDNEDSIYIVGSVQDRASYSDMKIIKYNSAGIIQWNKTFQYAINYNSVAKSLAIGTDDNIYVGGIAYTSGLTESEMLLVKYDKNGNYLGNTTFQTSLFTQCEEIVIDSENNIIMVGENSSTGSAPWDMQVVKYKSSLIQEWNKTFSYEDTEKSEGLDVDSSDNIYVINYDDGAIRQNRLTKFYKNGTKAWDKVITDGAAMPKCRDIDIDNSTGKIYLTGEITVSGNGNDIIIIKCNSTGDKLLNVTWNNEKSSNIPDSGTGIWFEPSGSLVVVGHTLEPDNNHDIVTLTYSLKPSLFTLNSDATTPDFDGTFKLTWTDSINAKNYTIYNHTSYITEINASVGSIEGITTNEYDVLDLPDGTYYYMIQARNEYGNTTSNYNSITVCRTPGAFDLSTNTTLPHDNDGIFGLNWTTSEHAENYSIYIRDIPSFEDTRATKDTTGATLYASGITSNQTIVDLSSYGNQFWYIIVIAYNSYGGYQNNTWCSLEVNATIGIPPGSISLNALYAPNPDPDGIFTLNWSAADRSDYFTLYWAPTEILIPNFNASGNVKLLYNGTATSIPNTYAEGWASGTYYFRVFAFNPYGNSSSSSGFNIIVDREGGAGNGFDLPWWLVPIITGSISAVVGIAIRQTFHSIKKRRIFMQEVKQKFEQIDNVEAFLKEKLDYEEWQKLKGPLDKYKNRQINNKDLIKLGKKEIGKDFTKLFTADKKQK
ncbi:MAG: hypothetical protein ACFE8B_11990 [Candidatus Hermodarchaeota archaeon]